MWSSRSVNTVLVDGAGQIEHSAAARGRITRFHAGDRIDFVEGEAAEAYGGRLDRFTRSIAFIKPDWVVIAARLEAPRPATFQWLLHAPTAMAIDGQRAIAVRSGGAACRVSILAPEGLEVSQTDTFDPPPRERIKLRQFHVTAATRRPAARALFLTAIQPHRADEEPLPAPRLEAIDGGYAVRLQSRDGAAVVLVGAQGKAALRLDGLESSAEMAAFRLDAAGAVRERYERTGGEP
jgi:hypothetical protein